MPCSYPAYTWIVDFGKMWGTFTAGRQSAEHPPCLFRRTDEPGLRINHDIHRDILHQRGKSSLVAECFNEAPFLQLDEDFRRDPARHINPVTAQSREREIAGISAVNFHK